MRIISEFGDFLYKRFLSSSIFIDEFKPELQFVEIDCFENQPMKLAVEMSPDAIEASTVSKAPTIEFSLCDYVFSDVGDAKEFILQIKESGKFPVK